MPRLRSTSSTTRRPCRRATCRSSSGRFATPRSRSAPRRSCSSATLALVAVRADQLRRQQRPEHAVGHADAAARHEPRRQGRGGQAARGRTRRRRRHRDRAGLDRIERRKRARRHLRRRWLDDLLDHDRPGTRTRTSCAPTSRTRSTDSTPTRSARSPSRADRGGGFASSDIEIEITAPDEQSLDTGERPTS